MIPNRMEAMCYVSCHALQSAVDVDGKLVNFTRYAGKVVIVVNVASACGFTDENYRGVYPTMLYVCCRAYVSFAFIISIVT